MNRLLILNRLSAKWRIPAKVLTFGVVWAIVCYPNPLTLMRHLRHCRDPQSLLDSRAPELEPLLAEMRCRFQTPAAPEEVLKTVEQYVYTRIPYEWDWNTWGAADYLPTVAEAIRMGKEDCDGRAVVAASLLRGLGYHAELATDFAHMWVRTEHGELMAPGKKQAVVFTDRGATTQPGALAELPRALAYGISPFPLARELVILLALWYLLLRSECGAACAWAGLAFLVNALLFLKKGGEDYRAPIVWMQVVGAANLLVGVGTLCLAGRVWWPASRSSGAQLGESSAATAPRRDA
ncbi:MAG: transglutaminase domain-containing protein [Planctomycetes bacterium]|nr:transglutaminase domain-containing protein [Planctomycetota bacterium]